MHVIDQAYRDRLTLGLARDMVEIGRDLDALRAIAYRDGIPPIYEEDAPRAGPWDRRDELLGDLAAGYARLDIMRRPSAVMFVGEEGRKMAEKICEDIKHQSEALLQRGFLFRGGTLVDIAARDYGDARDTSAMVSYYERKANEAEEKVNATGAVALPLIAARDTGQAL